MTSRFLVVLIAAAIVVGCSGAQVTPNGVRSMSSSPALLAMQTSGSPAEKRDNGEVFRQSDEPCHQAGGTWKIPTIGKRIAGDVEYGPNQCPEKERLGVESFADQRGSSCNNQQGYTFAGLGVRMTPGPKEKFSGANLTATINSKTLDPSKKYTVFLFDDNYKVFFKKFVGAPNGQVLNFPTPFQDGFKWSTYYPLTLLACYGS